MSSESPLAATVEAALTGFVHPVWAMAASVTVVLANSFGDRVIPLPGWRRPKKAHISEDDPGR